MRAVVPCGDSIKVIQKDIPQIINPTDAIVKVTCTAICTSDLHIINNAVPRYVSDTVLGHEFVGEIVSVGDSVKNLKVGDRVAANCITFCGECWFCRHGFINNCINGGWELGCRIDGGQAEYVRVPYADTGLNKIPDNVSDENAVFVGDILSSGYFAAEDIKQNDTVAVIGAGPVGLCAMICARYLGADKIIAIDVDESRLEFAKQYADYTVNPNKEDVERIVKNISEYGADYVIEAAGGNDTFQTAWKIARPNATVFVVAMYEEEQTLPLNIMYGKNLTFKTGGVDAIHCDKLLKLISENKISTDFLISKRYSFDDICEAYNEFKKKECYKIIIKM